MCVLVAVFINLYTFKILIPTEVICTSEHTIFVAKLALFYQIKIFLNCVIKYLYAKDMEFLYFSFEDSDGFVIKV